MVSLQLVVRQPRARELTVQGGNSAAELTHRCDFGGRGFGGVGGEPGHVGFVLARLHFQRLHLHSQHVATLHQEFTFWGVEDHRLRAQSGSNLQSGSNFQVHLRLFLLGPIVQCLGPARYKAAL